MMVSDPVEQLGRQAGGAVHDASRGLLDSAPTVNDLKRRQRARQRRKAVTAAAGVTGLITVALVGVSQLEDPATPMVGNVPAEESPARLPDDVVAATAGDEPFAWQFMVKPHNDAWSPDEDAVSPREEALSSDEAEWCVAISIRPDQAEAPEDSVDREDCAPLSNPEPGSVGVDGVFSEADGAALMWGTVGTDATSVVATLEDGELHEAALLDGPFEGQLWVVPYQGGPETPPTDVEAID